MSVRLGRIPYNPAVLGDFLGLPPGHVIKGAQVNELGQIELFVEGPAMGEVQSAEDIKTVFLDYRSSETTETLTVRRVKSFWTHLPDEQHDYPYASVRAVS